MRREVLDADRSLLPLVERRLQEVLCEAPSDLPWLGELRLQIASRLCDGHPRLSDQARRIGASAKPVQRRLAERGLVDRGPVQQTRHRLALQSLEEGKAELTEIPFLLRYSELSAFAQTFRGWTGRSPAADRRERRAGV